MNQTQSEYNSVVACMKDPTVRATIYRREADNGNAMAMADLGQMYEFGNAGLPKDDAEAVQWDQKSAVAGFTPAADRLKKLAE